MKDWGGNETTTCKCGSHFRKLERVLGRIDEAFVSQSGESVPPSLMLDFAEEFLSTAGLGQYRIVQKDINQIEILYVIGHEGIIYKDYLQKFDKKLKGLLGDKICINYNEKSDFINEKRFKRKIFVNEMKGKK